MAKKRPSFFAPVDALFEKALDEGFLMIVDRPNLPFVTLPDWEHLQAARQRLDDTRLKLTYKSMCSHYGLHPVLLTYSRWRQNLPQGDFSFHAPLSTAAAGLIGYLFGLPLKSKTLQPGLAGFGFRLFPDQHEPEVLLWVSKASFTLSWCFGCTEQAHRPYLDRLEDWTKDMRELGLLGGMQVPLTTPPLAWGPISAPPKKPDLGPEPLVGQAGVNRVVEALSPKKITYPDEPQV